MGDLDRPASPEELYLARGDEVDLYRPVLQGDLFRGVAIPGVDDDADNLAVVITHACSMRAQGGHLKSHLHMARAYPGHISLAQWPTGHFAKMPLPEALGPGRDLVSDFDLAGRVPTAELDPARRVACLERRGILLLQQRLAFHHTRYAVELDALYAESAAVLEEADLLEEWLRRFAVASDLGASLHAEEEQFDTLMSREHEGKPLRLWLRDPAARAMVRRAVYGTMDSRGGSTS